jgi:hypothetical protein
LINCDLVTAPAAVGTAAFIQTGGNSTFRGGIQPGQSLWIRGDGTGGHTTLTAPNGFRNAGALLLESINGGYSSSLTVVDGTLVNAASGVITVGPGAGGPRTISADLQNLGTIAINYGATLDRTDGVYENLGAWTIAAGNTLSISGKNQLFRQQAGTLDIEGGFTVSGMAFEYDGGTISGWPYLVNCDLTLAPGAVGDASFIQTGGNSRLHGDLKAGQTLWVRGDGTGQWTTLTALKGFSNAGTLLFETRNGAYSCNLTVAEGALTNAASGVITVGVGAGGPRTISADLLNLGTIAVNQSLTLSRANGVYENLGAWSIASGQSLSISGQNQLFRQQAGTLAIEGGFTANTIAFNYDGGTISGWPYLINCDLTFGPGAVAAASFIQTGGNSTFRGQVGAGQTLWVRGGGEGGWTTLTVPQGFVNRGTLRCESITGAYSSDLTVTEGALTNAPGGLLQFGVGTTGPRNFRANLVNLGTVEANWNATFPQNDKSYVNEGQFTVAAERTLTIGGSGWTFEQNDGWLTLLGALHMDNGTFSVRAGALTNAGSFYLANGTFNHLGGTIVGNNLYLVRCAADLTSEEAVTGSYILSGQSTLKARALQPGQEVWVRGDGTGGHTLVTAPDGFANGGRLRLESINGGYSSALTLSAGAITNLAGGVIDINPGAGGARTFNGGLRNAGTVNVNYNSHWPRAQASYLNTGQFTVGEGWSLYVEGSDWTFGQDAGTLTANGTLRLAGGGTFNMTGGTLANPGSFQCYDGAFNHSGGTIVGNHLYLVRCATDLTSEEAVTGSYILSGQSILKARALQPGQEVWVRGDGTGGHTLVTAPNGFVNGGRLRLESANGGYQTDLTLTEGAITNLAGGVIEVNPGAGGSRNLTADVRNAGTVNINYNTRFGRADGVFLNEGQVTVAEGWSFNLAGSYAQVDGATWLNGGRLVPAGAVSLQGGGLFGVGTVVANVTSSGRISPGASVGTITIQGNYTQNAAGSLDVEITAPSEYDQLVVTGSATLAGRLRVTLPTGFTPTNGQAFLVLTAAAVQGLFTTVDLPTLPSGLTWRVRNIGNAVELRVESAPAVTTEIAGSVKSTRGAPIVGVGVYAARNGYLGLRGEYYTNTAFEGTPVVRLDAGVNFGWGSGAPAAGVGADYFSVRWSGQVVPLYSETYTFYTVSDDGVRLWVDGRQIINNWTAHSTTENSGAVQMEAGRKYDLVMEYFENAVTAVAKLLWSSPSQAKEPIPFTALSPSSIEGIEDLLNDLSVVATLSDANGDYALGVGNGTWTVGVNGLADLKYNDVPTQNVVVADNRPIVNFVAEPFSGEFFEVATASNPADAGTTTGAGSYPADSTVTVTATPNTTTMPWQFVNWTEAGVVVSTSSQFSFTVGRDRQLQANFVLPKYSVSVAVNPPGAGAVAGAGEYTHGTTARLTAQPAFGYQFANWTEDSTVLGTDSVLAFAVTQARQLVANFAAAHLTHEVTTATAPEGLAAVAGAGTYRNGETATISAPTTVTNGPTRYTFTRFLMNGAFAGAAPAIVKTFATTDPTNMHYVAEYAGQSIRPLVVAVQGSRPSPVPATTNYVLSVRFDRSMLGTPLPTVLLTNEAPGALQVGVAPDGSWSTTAQANDTYQTGPITFSLGMDGTNSVLVAGARALDGNELAPTNVFSLVVDATPPTISNVAATAGPVTATVSWGTDEPTTAQVDYGPDAGYGTSSPLDATLVTAHQVVLRNLNPDTLYHFRVRSSDRAGNETLSGDGTFHTPLPPDLQVANLRVEPPNPMSGSALTISWEDANTGLGATVGSWNDLLVISNPATGARLLETAVPYAAATEGSLAPGASKARAYSFRLPDGPEGTGALAIQVTVDAGNSEFEYNAAGTGENNNTASVSVTSTLAPYPDLLVTSIQGPAGALAGQAVELIWVLTNQGTGSATKQWADLVSLATAPDGSGAQRVGTLVFTNGLAAGSSFTRTQTVILPNGIHGERFVVVTADANHEVYELDEANNSRVAEAALKLLEADLAIDQFTVHGTEAQLGQSIAVSWVIRNAGDAPAAAHWSDRLVLSSAPDGSGGRVLLTRPAGEASPLAPGATYAVDETVTIPMDLRLGAGTYYLVLTTDAGQLQPESNEGNNTQAGTAVSLRLPPMPDLVVTNVVAPDLGVPGVALELSWSTLNQGDAPAAGPWAETIYLSLDDALGQDQVLATFIFTNSLAAGDLVTRTQQVTLPLSALAGAVRLIVEADSNGMVAESNEANNFALADGTTAIPANLTLKTSAASIAENATNAAIRATVARNGLLTAPLTITITNSDSAHLTAPSSVTIAAGQASAGFDLAPVPDGVVAGDHQVSIGVSAPDFVGDSATVTVLESDIHQLRLQATEPNVLEGKTVALMVTRDTVTADPLLVRLRSSNSGRLLAPDSVSIAANQASATFLVLAVDNEVIELPTACQVVASAEGYAEASAWVNVLDNDIPQVRVNLPAPTIGEGSGVQPGMGTVTREVVTSRPVTVELESSDPNAIWVPNRVVLPANAGTAFFQVVALDDQQVNGTRQVVIRAFVLDNATGTVLAEGQSASVEVTDNDGPTLTLTLARSLVAEGLTPATTATVSRNVTSGQPLVVDLQCSDATEARVPATATIPGGSNSASFSVDTLQDGVADGSQTVTLTASATGFNSGSALLVVSDVDLPDLVIANLTSPAQGQTDELLSLSYRLANQGLSAASGTWRQRVYLSVDPVLSADDLLLGEYPFTGDLPVGQSFEQSLTSYMPPNPGDYWVIAVADAANNIRESLENNNVAATSAPLHVRPAYTATVSTDVQSAPAGTAVPLYGTATKLSGGPAAFVTVSIYVKVRDVRRVLAALTDADGRFTTTFQPLPGEAGHYEGGAAHPGEGQVPVQAEFTLLGMRANPAEVDRRLTSLSSVTGTFNLENLSEIPLSGITATVAGAVDLKVQVEAPNALAGWAAAPVSYTIESLVEESAAALFVIRLTSAEGVTVEVPVNLEIQARQPHLLVEPSALSAGMVRGEQTLLRLHLQNVGGAASGPLQVSLPEASWLHVASVNPMPSLNPGETNDVVLQLVPPPELEIGEYKGALAISGTGVGVSIPFTFKNVSSAVGDVKITTVDERTYYGDNPTNLAGATIVILDPFNGQTVARGQSGPDGVLLLSGVREGTYNMEVSAPKHDTSATVIEVVPGQLNERTIFLRTQLVTYTWTVEEIEIEDRTKIVLETVYETFVPTPVVTVEPSLIDLAEVQGDEAQIDLKITNQGLIAAQDVKLHFDAHSHWSITPLISEVASLPAKSSLTIPLIIRRIPQPPQGGGEAGKLSAGADASSAPAGVGGCSPCGISAHVDWVLICGPFKIAYPVPILVINACYCPSPRGGTPRWGDGPPPPPVGIGGWGSGPGGGGGWEVYDYVPPTFIRSSGPSYAPTNNCACDAATFKQECVKVEGGVKFDAPKKVMDVVKSCTPPGFGLEGVKIKTYGMAQMCTCCENGIRGLKAKSEIDSELEIKFVLGKSLSTTNQFTVEGLGEVTCAAEIMVGLETVLYGRVKATVETECNLRNLKACLAIEAGTKATAGIRGSAKLKAVAPDGTTMEGSGKVLVGVELSGSVSAQGCTDGKMTGKAKFGDVVAKAEVEGALKGPSGERYVKAGYSYELMKGGEWPIGGAAAGGSPGAALAEQWTGADVAEWMGYNSPQEMVQKVGGGSAPSLSAGASVEELAQAIQAARAFKDAPRRRIVTYEWRPPVPAAGPEPATRPAAQVAKLGAAPAGAESGVCAQVRLRVEQDAILTRKAVGATLEIANQSDTTPLEQLNVAVCVYDEQGELVNDRFVILPPELTGIEKVGDDVPLSPDEPSVTQTIWRLAAGSTGRARWVILPKDEAAPTVPVVYYVGGAMNYTAGGVPTSAILVPSPVNVYPNAKLRLKYFHQREVFSDDPFTPEVEPAEPFTLAVMVQNAGRGLAKNFSITSAQPKIVENEKGLLIDFDIIATEVAGQGLTPSLKASFGDVGPGDIKIGRWLFKASLLGFFLDYRASFEHEDSLGGRETSLIDSVDIHELIHLVEAPSPFADGKPDFLVNDDKDDEHLPELIYLSDGATNDVAAVLAASTAGDPGTGNHEVQLTANMPAGWAYLRVPDPAGGALQLSRVVRSDGRQIAVNTNVWITHYTFVKAGERPRKESRLHLLDYDSTGSYTLFYAPAVVPDTTPPESLVAALPERVQAKFPVQWSGQDTGSGVAFYDVYVSVNGGPFLTWLQKTRLNGALYQGQFDSRYAFYSVATDAAGNREAPHAQPDAQTTVALRNTAPTFAAVPDQTINEGDTLRLTVGATDPDVPADTLTYSLGPGAPAGASIAPGTGELLWQTGESQGGATNRISVVVTDSGSPPMSATNTVTVAVREVNTAPSLAPIPNQRIGAGQTLRLAVQAADPDSPANVLTFALAPGAPSGAVINPASGLLEWTPTAEQAPSTNVLSVIVTDNGLPPLGATNTFIIEVKVLNQPPSLASIPDRRVEVGALVIVTNRATDADLPAQTLTFSLEPGAPAGAAINPVTGLFTWRPSQAQAQTTNRITVTVTDNGTPPMSDHQTFTVIVSDYFEVAFGSGVFRTGEAGSVTINVISSGPVTNLAFALPVDSNRLQDLELTDLAPEVAGAVLQPITSGVRVEVAASPGQSLQGARQLAKLAFAVAADQTSAFVTLQATDIQAASTVGLLEHTVGRPGRVVIVGREPLLEAQFTSLGSRRLVVYGEPGAHVQLQTTPALGSGVSWQPWRELDLPGLFVVLDDVPLAENPLFYRALRP